MKCLYELTVTQLNDLVENELNLENWWIINDKLNNRKDSILKSKRFKTLKNRAIALNYHFNDIEIVTWLDTLMTMYYVFNKIEDKELINHITILQEYCMPFSNKRADYVLTYDNKILIIEFSFNKLNYEFNYEIKLQQAIGYKELLGNILPKEIDIGTYTFLLEAEMDENWNKIYSDEEQHGANYYKYLDLANYIEKFFKKNLELAINSIRNINY